MGEFTANPEPILQFDHATVAADPAYDTGLFDVNFTLAAGELALIRLERQGARLPLADAACGVLDLEDGVVRFQGQDWQQLSFADAIRRRGQIGRNFEENAWVHNLDVDESIMLAQRHHTSRPDKEIAEEAARLARQFGLPGIPRGRPSGTRRQDLHRAGLVRAFLGTPALLMLERPEQGVFPQVMPALINAVQSARRRGAAILWLTDNPEIWRDPGIHSSARYVASGSQLFAAREGEDSG
jgi:phospholipid/cholesterol/gamma-HCH transport system ATP-binding protein